MNQNHEDDDSSQDPRELAKQNAEQILAAWNAWLSKPPRMYNPKNPTEPPSPPTREHIIGLTTDLHVAIIKLNPVLYHLPSVETLLHILYAQVAVGIELLGIREEVLAAGRLEIERALATTLAEFNNPEALRTTH